MLINIHAENNEGITVVQTATILLEGKTNNWSKIRRGTEKKSFFFFSETWAIKEIVSILFKILIPQE